MSAVRTFVRARRRLLSVVAAATVLAGFPGVPLARGAFSTVTANLANNAGAAGSFTPMVITVDTTKAGANPRQVTLPLRGNVNVGIDWGGSTENCPTSLVSTNQTTDTACTYSADGQYTIKLYGSLAQFGTGGSAAYSPANAPRIMGVTSWGGLGLQRLAGAFTGATNLITVPADLPGTVTTLAFTFFGASSFNNANVSTWNTAAVATLASTFRGAAAFDQPLAGWNTANVTSLAYTFGGATMFNRDLSSWNTANVTSLNGTFAAASTFNQPLGTWNTAQVTNMGYLFNGATAFNQDIGAWNTANVSTMAVMFQGAAAFDQNLSGWCVTAITSPPANFDFGATAWAATNWRPTWGTCPTVPAQTTAVTAAGGDAQVALSWTAPANGGAVITGYDLRYATNAAMTGATVVTNATTGSLTGSIYNAAGTAYTLTGLTNGTSLYVQVRATNVKGTATAWGPTTPAVATPYPATVMAVSDVVLWLDAADPSTMFTDTAGTTPVSSSTDTVARWNDKSTQANTATQAAAGSRPALTTIGDRLVPTFDGSVTGLSMDPTKLPTGTSASTTFVVAQTTGTSGLRAAVSWGSGGSKEMRWLGQSDGQMNLTANGTPNPYNGTWAAGTTRLAVGQFASAAATLWNTGSAPVSVAGSFTTGTSVAAVGNSAFSNQYWQGPIHEIIVVNRTLTDAERRTIETYLATKWGLTLAPAAPTATIADRNVVSTFAGSGTAGSTDATGTAASFNRPNGVVVDGSGNVFVADRNNHKIRKITPAGAVTTLAGSGTAGGTDGTGSAASFTEPIGIALDATGNLYVAEWGGNRIRRITPAGVVTTVAGSGTAASVDGTGTGASFNKPIGIAISAAGDLYVSDWAGNQIRKVTSAGVVTTFAGSGVAGTTNGTGTNATFTQPYHPTFDPAGNLYVPDYGTGGVRRITPAGVVTTVATGFSNPVAVAADPAGNLFVAEDSGNRIRRLAPDLTVTTVAGTGAAGALDGAATGALFNGPGHVALGTNGNLYVAVYNSHTIRTIAPVGSGSLAVLWTAPVSTGGSTITDYLVEYRTSPSGAWTTVNDGVSTTTSTTITGLTDGTAYDIRISAINAAGTGTASATATATPATTPGAPTGLTLTPAAGQLTATWTAPTPTGGSAITDYVVEYRTSPSGAWTVFPDGVSNATTATITGLVNGTAYDVRISAANSLGAGTASSTATRTAGNPPGSPTALGASRLHVTTLAGSGSAGSTDATGTAASFNKPQGVVVSSTGDTYVADFGSNKIRKITPAGVVTTFAGSGTAASVDGTGTGASFNQPVGLALDTADNLYVTDFGSNSIRKITPAGVVTTLAGSGTAGSTDGTGTGASFNQPGYITVDPNGTLYVSDYGSGRIRRVTPGGVVTTIATGLNGPVGIGIDPTGNLVVAEFGANRVRNVTLAGAVSTLAGSGTAGSADDTGTAASFNGPHGVSVDKAGYVYVTDRTTNRIRLITPGGVVTTIAGTGTAGTADGPTSIATLNGPGSVTLDASNNLVTGDWTGNKIRRITAAGSGSLAVAWTAPASTGGSAITDYLVEYRTSPSGAWTTFNDGVSTTTTATITGLTDGTAYDVRVSAVNAAGTGTASTAATATPGTAPGAPTGLTLTAGAGQLSASWTAPATTGGSAITDYAIEYRTSPTGTWTVFPDGISTATSATITGLTNGTAYDVRISAANSLGAGTASATATATPDAAPAAPTGLTATASTTTAGALDLTWTTPASNGGSTITDYTVEYRTSPSGTWTTFADGTSTATTATISGLAGAAAYDVRVSAVNAAGTGAPSTTATATAPRAWNPADLASAATWWLDATASVATSGTAVTSWNSRAGTGMLTVPSGSTAPALATNSINGLATVRFTNDILSGADLFGGSSTNFNAVAVMRENTASGNWFLSFNGADTGTTRFSLHAPWTDRTWYDDAGGYTTNRATISGAPTAVGATTLVTLWKDQTAGNNGLRLNGGAFSATSSGSTAATTTGGLRIGTNTFDHDLAELLAFNRRLTTTEQNLVEGYLAWRWGTQALLPAGHPHKTNPPLTTASLTAPGAPTGAAAIAGDTQAAVSWTAPASDGGSAVTGYTATATAAGQTTRTCTTTAPTTNCTITGLVNGVTYAVSVTATNAVGTGSSSATTTVTPT